MSKVALEGNASGTGTFTIASPNSNNSRTMALPDSAGDLVVTQATQTLSNKTFSGAQVFGTASLAEPSGGAPLYMARAWVNFNGTGTVAIRAAGNVTSITDSGAGNYAINMTTAMADVNYAVVATAYLNEAGTTYAHAVGRATTTSQILLGVVQAGSSTALVDSANVQVAIFR